jgi:hypothetical protein
VTVRDSARTAADPSTALGLLRRLMVHILPRLLARPPSCVHLSHLRLRTTSQPGISIATTGLPANPAGLQMRQMPTFAEAVGRTSGFCAVVQARGPGGSAVRSVVSLRQPGFPSASTVADESVKARLDRLAVARDQCALRGLRFQVRSYRHRRIAPLGVPQQLARVVCQQRKSQQSGPWRCDPAVGS